MTSFTFNTVPSIICAPGAIKRLGEIVLARLGSRIALVTDAGLVKAGIIEPALLGLRAAGVAVSVFDKVVADPPESVVMEAVAGARAHEATVVIGLGGGSSMDVAKLVALLAHSPEALADIYGVGNVKGKRLPLLLAPTTAGTGSEVTPISIVTTGAHEKKGVVSPVILPDLALLDPELTLGLPPHVTAATGIDAMVHAIEAYTSASPNNNPVSRAGLRGLAASRPQHPPRGAPRLGYRGAHEHADRIDAGRPGLCELAGRRRACLGLSDRRAFRRAARSLERSGAGRR